MFSINSMPNQRSRTFRLSLIRRRIVTLCQSRALRAALLAAVDGGPDAALVVEMVERVRPPSSLPTQVVTPVPQEQREEARVENPVAPVPQQQGEEARVEEPVQRVNPSSQEGPNQTSPQNSGDIERNPIVILDSDSDSEFSD